MGLIIGRGGANITKFKAETKTNLVVRNNTATIVGPDDKVQAASIILQHNILEAKKRHRPTHFVSFPMSNPQITESFEKFKKNVLVEDPIAGLNDKIFQKPTKLHLTIGVMALLDENDLRKATETLEDCHKKLIKPFLETNGPVKIHMREVTHFDRDKTSNVNVVYANVYSENNSVHNLGQMVLKHFQDNDLMTTGTHAELNLHVTLINTKYGSDYSARFTKQSTIDAKSIIERHGSIDFGEMHLDCVEILCMKTDSTGMFYEKLSSVPC